MSEAQNNSKKRATRPAVLVIAATDSSGGAGLARDVRTLTEFSVDALCVVTAVTAQSDKRVTAIHHVPPDVIRAQVSGALETRRVGAIKIGMLGTRATVDAVAEGLAMTEIFAVAPAATIPVVVDPVLVSSSGSVLLDAAGRAALLEKLLPLATLVTPNVPEIAALLGEAPATGEAELIRQGRQLLEFGSRAILLKGGHAEGDEAVDLLIADGDIVVQRIKATRVTSTSRGTGCALASGIAAGLASGLSLADACRRAKSYVLENLLTPSTHESKPKESFEARGHER